MTDFQSPSGPSTIFITQLLSGNDLKFTTQTLIWYIQLMVIHAGMYIMLAETISHMKVTWPFSEK